MRQRVEFGLQIGQLRSARAGSGGIAALRHEAVDHAVKRRAVVETAQRQRLDPLDMFGRPIGLEPDGDATAGRQIEQPDILTVLGHIGIDHRVERPVDRQTGVGGGGNLGRDLGRGDFLRLGLSVGRNGGHRKRGGRANQVADHKNGLCAGNIVPALYPRFDCEAMNGISNRPTGRLQRPWRANRRGPPRSRRAKYRRRTARFP